MKTFFKVAAKWGTILGAVYAVSLLLSGLDADARARLVIFGFAMAITYMDGAHKDRMAALEHRITSLERQLRGSYRQ